jgi:hypothetical protein
MKLFEDKNRTDIRPAKHIDNEYNFYDRSASPQVSIIREKLNQWFENYPSHEKLEMKARFMTSFSSAFYELFLHELFIKQGFTIEIHPDMPDTKNKPDFLVRGNGVEFYLEAKEATDTSDESKSVKNKQSRLFDELNETNSPNFFICIDNLVLKSNSQPSGRKVRQFLENKLQKFNPDDYEFNNKVFKSVSDITYEDEDLLLEISLLSKSKELRGKSEIRPIGVYPGESWWGGTENSIKSSIIKKAKRYGKLDKPLLICINSTSEKGTDDYDVLNALFGDLRFSYSTNPDPTKRNERLDRSFDGFFGNPSNRKYTKVSGVLITNVYPSNLHIAKHWLVKHPFSMSDLNMDVFALTNMKIQRNELPTLLKKNINEILEISNNWLEGEWF